MVSKIIIIFCFSIFISSQLRLSMAQTNWIRAGFSWCLSDYGQPISEIDFSLFTHIICGDVYVNSISYKLNLSLAEGEHLSTFTRTIKQNNPPVIPLLSILDSGTAFSPMVSNSSNRKTFIDSSIKIARRHGFEGLDFHWQFPHTSLDMFYMGLLFKEWKAAINLEATNSSQSQLILTANIYFSPKLYGTSFPIEAIQQHLNWVHLFVDFIYDDDWWGSQTTAFACLYDPTNLANSDTGIREWIDAGLSSEKMVFTLPFYGFQWTLQNPMDNGFGAPAKRFVALNSENGVPRYIQIKKYIEQYGPEVPVKYNSTYAVNYWTKGTTWYSFNDVEAIRAKVSYAKENKLLGYIAWAVNDDYNWVLSKTAAEMDINDSSVQQGNKKGQNKRTLLVILLSTTAALAFLLSVIFYCWKNLKFIKGMVNSTKESHDKANKAALAGDFNANIPNLTEYTLAEIEAATNGFSIENKLGEGGYGSVYKGILPDGHVIALKKLSKTSTQGFEEFENEVTLTAKLQHVNLLQVLGFCLDTKEQIIIYPYMQNKSLDTYIFDPVRRLILDWKKRVDIIEGVTQGLLYLQEYSRLTIIHRDLKVSNVLLDEDMKPKISDFGLAKMFAKDDFDEANTSRIVGTIGYVPPEYINKGTYSTKLDVYSFGILLLQIISGKKISLLYGLNENLSLPNYAYELWSNGKGMEFIDESLDDTNLSCKTIRCLQIALLCVQEDPDDRPSMLEVFVMLKSENKNIMIPKRPAFSKANEQYKSTM
ncbi:putative cysteine-rich receptor-like protein kinase 16 [Mangifera indica]|uniref:putative cysteine-rich receptor-like protein kinase 16 n=1 Tax=Mangifera indica TaxID=29780 RepID=UPI001CFAD4E9|nr:putative cysteine-rich receptor-like protein kinase 16 [Mangifera indica]